MGKREGSHYYSMQIEKKRGGSPLLNEHSAAYSYFRKTTEEKVFLLRAFISTSSRGETWEAKKGFQKVPIVFYKVFIVFKKATKLKRGGVRSFVPIYSRREEVRPAHCTSL